MASYGACSPHSPHPWSRRWREPRGNWDPRGADVMGLRWHVLVDGEPFVSPSLLQTAPCGQRPVFPGPGLGGPWRPEGDGCTRGWGAGGGGRGRASLEPVGECEGQGEQRVLTWTLTPWRNRGSVVFSCHNKRVEAHTTLIAWALISFPGSSDGRRVRLLVNISDDFLFLLFSPT